MDPRADRGVTAILEQLRQGDRSALDQLVPLVYEELRWLAESQLRRERPGHTLQPTSLVHEAYLRLSAGQELHFDSRAHFFAASANLMRQILVDYARARATGKRGSGRVVALATIGQDAGVSLPNDDEAILDIDHALGRLAGSEPRMAQLVEMRFFGGMTAEESATALAVSVHVVRHELRLAQAWLKRELSA